jgi:hypothetical protein
MNCREFREHHLAFLDNTLSDANRDVMQRHAAACPSCERRDTAIRRGLLVLRNLTPVEPSPDFTARLNTRLQQLRQHETRIAAAFRGPSTGSFLAIAAGVVAVGFVAVFALNWTEPRRDMALAPAVVTAPAPRPQIVDHAYLVSAVTSIPAWPAVVLAEEVPMQMVSAEAELANWTR